MIQVHVFSVTKSVAVSNNPKIMVTKIISILSILFIAYSGSHEFGEDDAKKYLSNFGYMTKSTHDLSSCVHNNSCTDNQDDSFSEALTKFQDYFSLTVTGKLNNETISMMKTPRCGYKDNENAGSAKNNSIFENFELVGKKLEKKHITYKFVQYTNQLPKSQVDDTIRRAFEVWSAITHRTFKHKNSGSVDIYLGFYKHGHSLPDGTRCEAFDGNFGVLAHAVPPTPDLLQFLHFDDDERWTVGLNNKGIDLFQVAVHEIGHIIGLGHSNVRKAVMFPSYNFNPNFKLDKDDIMGVLAKYGSKKKQNFFWKRNRTSKNKRRHADKYGYPNDLH